MVNKGYAEAKEKLIKVVDEKENNIWLETDNEYYYAIGQCISFMSNRYVKINKMFKKNLVTREIMLSKNNDILKKRLMTLFRKCSTMLYNTDKRFNKCMSMVLGYIPDDSKVNDSLLQLGYVDNNILI